MSDLTIVENPETPIYSTNSLRNLVFKKAAEKGLDREGILKALPYANKCKAARRLDELVSCDLRNKYLIDSLKVILNISEDEILTAIDSDIKRIRASVDLKWRSTFKPSAFAIFEIARPKSLTIAGFVGAGRFVIIDLTDVNPDDYLSYVLKEFKEEDRAAWLKRLFHTPIAFGISYTPDHAEYYSWEGKLIGSRNCGKRRDEIPDDLLKD